VVAAAAVLAAPMERAKMAARHRMVREMAAAAAEVLVAHLQP
jgi:hypothetical protein